MKKKKIFIAGHKGLVGNALVNQLKNENVKIITKTKKELNLLMSKIYLIRKDIDFIGYHHQKIDGRLDQQPFKALQMLWQINGEV